MSDHIALIPARKNSKGVKFKNRILFNKTAEFVKKLKFFNNIYVSSDDEKILLQAKKNNFRIHKRKLKYAKDNTSIKSTITNFCLDKKIENNTTIWLFYLPITNRKKSDFYKIYSMTKKKNFKSLCTFFKADYKYHPYYAWNINKKKVSQYVKNNVFRRQDLPEVFYHFHYICCFKKKELPMLNSELINKKTTPIDLNMLKNKVVFEIDTIQDLKKYIKN